MRQIRRGLVMTVPLWLVFGTLAATRPVRPPATPTADGVATTGRDVAERVARAAGLDVWPTVTRLRFTFNVAEAGVDGERVVTSVSHDWNVRAGTDTVTWDGRTVTARVDGEPPAPGTPEAAAYRRWTNDTYWLLAPLKLLDDGVIHGPAAMTRDLPPSRARITISFDSVGLTPGDRYDLAVDLRTQCITHWTYRPDDAKAIGFTWDNYQDFDGLVLATERRADAGDRRIFFTDVAVERE